MPSSVPSAPARFDRYAVGPWLASGGTATVHLGRLLGEAGFSRVVALKRSHPQLAADPEFTAMLVDEARLAARVRHQNVVPVLDVVHNAGELGLVLEYVHGESLSKLLHLSKLRGERPSVGVVATVISGVLHGLHAAHEARDEEGRPLAIVHRDVSPQNVLVGVDGVARVLDFGIAKALGRSQTTREGHVKGKLGYMAPEQLRGEAVDRRADVWSAAVVLWECLTGERLFSSDTEGATIHRVISGHVEPPSRLSPEVSPELDAIVLRGLSLAPDDRFATARDMALEVEAACGVTPSSVVGAWVEDLAAQSLAARAKLIAQAERLPVELPVVPALLFGTNFPQLALDRCAEQATALPLRPESRHVFVAGVTKSNPPSLVLERRTQTGSTTRLAMPAGAQSSGGTISTSLGLDRLVYGGWFVDEVTVPGFATCHTKGGSDALVVVADDALNVQWIAAFGSAGNEFGVQTLAGQGDVFVAGGYAQKFELGTHELPPPPGGAGAVYVARLAPP